MEYYNVPNAPVEVQDGAYRMSRPIVRPITTIIGYTNNTDIKVNEKYLLEDINSALNFRNSDGQPNHLTRAIADAFNGGAPTVEVVVTINNNASPTLGEYYNALETTYELITNTTIDYVVPAGVCIDDDPGTGEEGEERNFAYQLANFCFQATRNHQSASGFIGVKHPAAALTGEAPTLAEIETWVEALEDYDTDAIDGKDFTEYDGVTDDDNDGIPDNYRFWASASGKMPDGAGSALKDALGNPIDIGAYIKVTAILGKASNPEARAMTGNVVNGYYYTNGAASYAGMFAALPINRGPSHLPIPGISISNHLSLSQSSRLTTARFVTLVSRGGDIKTSVGVTGAHNINNYQRSDYTLSSTVKAVHLSIEAARRTADRFLGEYNTIEKRLSLENEINMALELLVSEGVLNGKQISIVSTQTDQLLGQVKVDLKLDVPGEIRQIIIRVALTLPGETL